MWNEPLRSLAGGVLWIEATTDVDALVAELEEWKIARVEAGSDATKQSLIASIGDGLGFPDWAGNNLDALYDLLTDLDWLDEGQPVAVLLDRSEAASATIDDRQDSQDWQAIVQVLIDAAAWWQNAPRTFLAIVR